MQLQKNSNQSRDWPERSPGLVYQRQNDLKVMVQEGSLTGSKPLSFAKMIADRNVLRKTSAPSCHDGLTSSMTSSRGEASHLFGLHFHLGFWGVHWWLMRNYAVTMRSQASCSRCWWISILPAIFLMSCLFLKSSHNQRLASEKGAVLWLIWEVVDSWLIEPFWETEKAEIKVFVKSPSKQLRVSIRVMHAVQKVSMISMTRSWIAVWTILIRPETEKTPLHVDDGRVWSPSAFSGSGLQMNSFWSPSIFSCRTASCSWHAPSWAWSRQSEELFDLFKSLLQFWSEPGVIDACLESGLQRHFRFHITTSHAFEALRNCVSRNSVSQHFYLSMNSLQDNLWNSEKPFNRVITCFLSSVIKDGDDLLMSRFATISIHPL